MSNKTINNILKSKIHKFLNLEIFNDAVKESKKETKTKSEDIGQTLSKLEALKIFNGSKSKKDLDEEFKKKLAETLKNDELKPLIAQNQNALTTDVTYYDEIEEENFLLSESEIPEDFDKQHKKIILEKQKYLTTLLFNKRKLIEEKNNLVERIYYNSVTINEKQTHNPDRTIKVSDDKEVYSRNRFAGVDRAGETALFTIEYAKKVYEKQKKEIEEKIKSLTETLPKVEKKADDLNKNEDELNTGSLLSITNNEPDAMRAKFTAYHGVNLIKEQIKHEKLKLLLLEKDYSIRICDDKIEKVNEEIDVVIKEEYTRINEEQEKEKIKELIGNIEDQEFIDELAKTLGIKKFVESAAESLNDILQTMNNSQVNSIELYDYLKKHSNLIGNKVKIITNIKKTANVNNVIDIYAEDQRFGMKNSSVRITKKYSLNDIIYDSGVSYVPPTKGKYSKKSPLMSYIMVTDPQIQLSSRNEAELSIFLNSLSTIELSKSTPYFNAMFILPDAVIKGGRVYKTASITQFLNGTKNNETDKRSKISDTLHSEYNKIRGESKKTISGTKTNMALFTAPQTLNNFDDVYVGRQSSLENEINSKVYGYTRANNIQDITRPFMTIKSFSINVAPTQGLMSFKSGKISLVIHDRSRMADMAPFIKPDLFGAFGAEIIVDYGWSNVTSEDTQENYLGTFIDSLKVREKYIITNSSFNITKNGEVNVDLSVAMKGPIDLKNTLLNNHSDITIGLSRITKTLKTIEAIKSEITSKVKGIRFGAQIEEKISSLLSTKNDKDFIEEVTEKNNFDDLKDYIKVVRNGGWHSLGAFDTKKIRPSLSTYNIINGRYYENFVTQTNLELYKRLDTQIGSADNIRLITFPGEDAAPSEETKELFISLLVNYYQLFKEIDSAITNATKKNKKNTEYIDNNIIHCIGKIDPFFDKKWSKDYKFIKKYDDINEGAPIEKAFHTTLEKMFGVATPDSETNHYISLGTIITSIIGVYLKESGKYDDIQIISYCVNKNAGLMGDYNISSLLISQQELREFLIDLLNGQAKISLEGILTRIIDNFISSKSNVCYGLSDLDDKLENYKEGLDERLQKIWKIKNRKIKNKLPENSPDFVEFQMPKIKMLFESVTKQEEADRTILRIFLYDENNNPYKNLSSMFTNENEFLSLTSKYNRLYTDFKTKNGPETDFVEKRNKIFKDLLDKKFIKQTKDGDGNIVYVIQAIDKIPAKKEIKKRVPSITYGTQNSGVLEASVTTINESNLNTVLMTRNDMNKGIQSNIKVRSEDNLPLQILPSKATVSMFGCPFVNFAQYMFLDFETGTTIDNFYAVTGIDHNLTPGNFTTSLTLSYGDVYGKYFSALTTTKKIVESIANREFVATETIGGFPKGSIIPHSIKPEFKKGYKSFTSNDLEYIINNDFVIKYKQIIVLSGKGEDLNPGKLGKNILQYKLDVTKSSEPFVISIPGDTTPAVAPPLAPLEEFVGPPAPEPTPPLQLEPLPPFTKEDMYDNISRIEITLNHYIERTENGASINLIPNINVKLDNIITVIFETFDKFEDAVLENLNEKIGQ